MQALTLSASVGKGGKNQPGDVLNLQQALNQIQDQIHLNPALEEDGTINSDYKMSLTCQAIALTQKYLLNFQNPDALIDCNGKTHQAINNALCPAADQAALFLPKITPKLGLQEDDFSTAAAVLKCDAAAIKAVADVESSGSGFFASGLPCILFEAHKFSKFTEHRYDESHPDISSRQWNRSLYLGGEKEYLRLQQAMTLERTAALKSASYGRFQIMGFNYKLAGYEDVENFVCDMFLAESNHLQAFVRFIESNDALLQAIQSHDWASFAYHYNGSGYAENHYDQKIASRFEYHKAHRP